MSTLDPKPIKKNSLNTKLLPIAALVLIVLALVFMATPLLRVSGVSGAGRTGFNRQFNGTGPTGTNGQGIPGGGNGYNFQAPGSNGTPPMGLMEPSRAPPSTRPASLGQAELPACSALPF